MNPEPGQPSRQQIEARITSLLLGELPAEEAALMRYTIAQDPALQQLHDELQSTLVLVREAAKQPADAPVAENAPPKLSPERRQQLLAHFKTPRPSAPPKPLFWLKRIEMPRLVPTLVAVAIIAVLAAMLLPALSRSKSRSMRMVSNLDEAAQSSLHGTSPSLSYWVSSASHALGKAMSASPAPPPSAALAPVANSAPAGPPLVVTVAPEPQLAPPPVQIVLPQPESAPEVAAPAGAPTATGKRPVYSQSIVGYANLPPDSSAPAVPSPTPSAASSPAPPALAGGGIAAPPVEANSGQLASYKDNRIHTVDNLERAEHIEKQWILPAKALDSSVPTAILAPPVPSAAAPAPAITPNGISPQFAENENLFTAEKPPAPLPKAEPPMLAGNRFYRNLAQVSEQKKAPLLGGAQASAGVVQSPLGARMRIPAAPPAAATPPAAAATPSAAFESNAGAPIAVGGTLESGASEREQNVYVFKITNGNPEEVAQVFRSRFQSGSRSSQSIGSSLSQSSALQTRGMNNNVGTTVAFTTASAPGVAGSTSGVAGDSFSTGLAKGAPPLPGVVTAASGNFAEDNKLLDTGRTRELQNQNQNHQANHNFAGFYLPQSADGVTEPNSVGVLDHSVPEQISGVAPEGGNQFISRYAYNAPISAGIDQLQTTNAVAMSGRVYNNFNPGTAAIVPNVAQEEKAIAPGLINFEGVDLDQVLDIYAKLAKRTVLRGSLPQAQIFFTNQTPLTRTEAMEALQYAMARSGVSLVNVGESFVKAIPSDQAAGGGGEIDRAGKESTLKHAAENADLPLRKPAPNAPVPQPEILTRDNAFSTFSLNVSDVSFKFAEASLQNGKLPDTASIRSEEFINAFDYRDPEAAEGQPMAFTSERARHPFAHNRELLRFAVKTAAAGRPTGRALNLVLLLDNSGSMERADRVAIIREALRVLATQLQPQDTVSVVTFARTARLWADGIRGDQAGETLAQVGGITPEGGTNLEEAMRLAYETARRHYLPNGVNRVVLLTDGAANLGNVDPRALTQKVEAQRQQGIALDCFGIGWEDYNDDLLEQLSSNGDGRYAFLNSPEDASRDFAAKLAGALQIAAADVKVQVEFNPGRVISYRQIGYATHQLTKEQFRDNTVAAGQIAAQEAGNALYTIETNPNGDGPIATVHVRYQVPGTDDYREHSWDVAYTGPAPALEQSSSAMRLAATAAAFSEWLAASPYAQEVTLDELLKYLSGVPEVYGADDRPKQLETMIREAKSLEGK